MECPRCYTEGFSSDGICRACNYKVVQKETSTEPEPGEDKSVHSPHNSREKAPENTETDPQKEELPPWRQELTERLTALKHEKETANRNKKPQIVNTPSAPRTSPASINTQRDSLSPEHTDAVPVRRQTQKTQLPSRNTPATSPQQKTIASLGPEVFKPGADPDSAESKDIRKLIDSAISKQSTLSTPETPVFRQETPIEEENKLILLSRTLSGLIDLIFIVLCTGVFIISADYFYGIVILDTVSLIEYGGLFLLTYFLYSIYFLAASGQTVGMMITDLRIVGIEGSRPSIGQLFSRCLGYLLSVIVFGAGLFWSLFDSKNRCFHDRFSNTSITRL